MKVSQEFAITYPIQSNNVRVVELREYEGLPLEVGGHVLGGLLLEHLDGDSGELLSREQPRRAALEHPPKLALADVPDVDDVVPEGRITDNVLDRDYGSL